MVKRMPTKQPRKNISSLLLNISTNLVAGVIVGLIIGLAIDKWLGAKPAFLIICMLLSMSASFKAIWKEMK